MLKKIIFFVIMVGFLAGCDVETRVTEPIVRTDVDTADLAIHIFREMDGAEKGDKFLGVKIKGTKFTNAVEAAGYETEKKLFVLDIHMFDSLLTLEEAKKKLPMLKTFQKDNFLVYYGGGDEQAIAKAVETF